MAYYSGIASSFTDLRTALVEACVVQGWTWDPVNFILSKGVMYYQIAYQDNSGSDPEGLLFSAGTGVASGALLGVSFVKPRMGRERTNIYAPTWPMTYSIHIFTGPDEVYFIARHSVDRFYWASFGQSTTPGLTGTGAYVSANFFKGSASTWSGGSDYSAVYSLYATENSYNGGSGPSYYPSYYSSGIFFGDSFGTYDTNNASGFALKRHDTINTGLTGHNSGWNNSSNIGSSIAEGLCQALPHYKRLLYNQPSRWSDEAILLPINVFEYGPSSTLKLVHSAKNARYVRIDNYEPEQIVSLGPDKWKIYPFIQKNTAYPLSVSSGGGNVGNHTGCVGWAIRYDGP